VPDIIRSGLIIPMLKNRDFIRAYVIQTLYMFPVVFSWGMVYLYLVKAGFSVSDLIQFKAFSYASAIAVMLVVRRFRTMTSMAVGFFGFAAEMFALPFVSSARELAVVGVIDGLTFPLFWIPYNTLYFSIGKGRESVYLAGLLFLGPPLMSVFVPVAAGMVLDLYGFTPVFAIGGVVLALSGAYYGRQSGRLISVDLGRAWSAGKGLKSLVLIQGLWQGVDWLCVSVYTIRFFTSGVSYGGFFSYVAVFGAVSTLYFCRLSDRSGNRVNYLYPSIFMTAAATVMSAYADDVVNWVLVRGMVGFFVAVSNPFTTSIVLDRMKNTAEAMHLREILLNAGRLAGIASVAACHLLLGGFQYAFILSGVALLTYPLLVEQKRLYKTQMRPLAMASDETMEFHD
jgi:hypothetical protein